MIITNGNVPPGLVMPNSLLSNVYEKCHTRSPDRRVMKDFWNRWWNRQILTHDNTEGWQAQMNFIKEVISYLENKKSTFGFEILNEPQVYRMSDYTVISHMIDNPLSQSVVTPNKNDDMIYDVHMYPPSYYNIQFFKFTSYLMSF